MGKKPRYKNVLFLIEGMSEKKAFEIAIPELFENIDESYQVFFPRIVEDGIEKGGDITSKYGITAETIEGCICKLFLDNFFEEQKIYPRHITEIIHIVDLDGAFVPNDVIRNGSNPSGEDKVFYGDDFICVNDVEKIINRNQRKRENIKHLVSLKQLNVRQNGDNPNSKQIPIDYSVYFFSSNLDHFINNNANMSSEEKVRCADYFAYSYIDDIDGFVKFFTEDPDALNDMSYEDSWKYIMQEGQLHSLKRHTNINILLTRLKEKTT